MNALGNVLWIVLGGFIIFILYLIGSLILFITIVGIPFGMQTLKMAMLSLFPFGKKVEPGERMDGCLYIIINILWVLVVGIEIATVHLVLALSHQRGLVELPLIP